jgi:hypothetical protein
MNFDTHCPQCQKHREAVQRAYLANDTRGARVHSKLLDAHWAKVHDRTPLALRLFKMAIGVK